MKNYFKAELVTEYSLGTALSLLLPLFLLYAVFFIYPLSRLFSISLFQPDIGFTLENYHHFFREPVYSKILFRTVRVSIMVALVCLVTGYPIAFALSRAKGRKLSIYLGCIILPFWMSILVRNYAWTVILQRNGVINNFLEWLGIIDSPLKLLYTDLSVIIGMVHYLLPFMVLPLFTVLKQIDPTLQLAAHNLGAKPMQTFLRVTFPLSLPGVGAGILFVFIIGLGFFITPALLGGPNNLLLSTLIERQILNNNWPFGAAIAVILLLVAIVFIVIFNKMAGFDKIFGGDL